MLINIPNPVKYLGVDYAAGNNQTVADNLAQGLINLGRASLSNPNGAIIPATANTDSNGVVTSLTAGSRNVVIDLSLSGGGGSSTPIQVTASRALTSTDNGATLYSTSASNFSLTVNAGLPAGFNCTLLQLGTGALSPVAGSATLTNSGSTTGANTYLGIANSSTDTYTLALPLSSSPYVYTGVWSGRPVSSLSVGNLALITDIPISGGGTLFYWDGTYWRPVGGRAMLYNLGANQSVAAPTVATETQVASFAIPARMIPPNGRLRFTFGSDKLNTTALTGNTNVRIGFNNTVADSQIVQLSMATTSISGGGFYEIQRIDSTHLQKSGAGQANVVGPMGNVSTTARGGSITVADMDASSNYFQVYVQIATAAGTETMVLHDLIVELFA